jgi:hypothetical protein
MRRLTTFWALLLSTLSAMPGAGQRKQQNCGPAEANVRRCQANLQQAEARAQQAEARAQQAETEKRQAGEKARQAVVSAQEAAAGVLLAETRARKAEEELQELRHAAGQRAGAEALENGVRAQLSQLRTDIRTLRESLTPMPCGSETCYSADDVATTVEKIRARLAEAIPAEAVGLRVALEDQLTTGLRTLEALPLDGNFPASLRAQAASQGYLARAVDSILKGLEASVDRLLGDDLTPNVAIRSTPQGAAFDIPIPGTVTTRRFMTNDSVPSLWRSVYNTVVSKKGYRTAKYTLDLMNDARTTVVCTLVPENTSGSSSCRVQ